MTRWKQALTALMATLVAPTAHAASFVEFHGTWIIKDHDASSSFNCTMMQVASPTNVTSPLVPYNILKPPFLTGYIDQTGKFQLLFTIDGLYETYVRGSNAPFEVKIDGADVPLKDTYSRDMDTIMLTGASTRTVRDIMEQSLEGGTSTIVVTGFGLGVKFQAQGSKAAIGALRRCEGKAAPTLASMDGPDPEEEETDENEGVNDALGSAMQGMTTQQPPIAQLRCSIAEEAIYGLPYMGSPRQSAPKIFTISIAEDGTALINGSSLKPLKIQRATDGSSRLISSGYAFQDVRNAMQGGTTLPSIGTLSAEENAALQAMPGLMNGMLDQVMGDRRRFMVVSLDASGIIFFDLDSQNETVKRAEAECVRTM